ncbi:hypothetical protein AGMMS49975_22020 [Clostridia bacterium]|nr:hypothetical protein AGMMS49975_22020 [Clostridia bacterium]
MGVTDIILLIFIITVVLFGALFFLNRYALKKMDEQNEIIQKTRQVMDIFVIDKKHCKASAVNLPKAVTDQMPKRTKLIKMYFVQAKIGPQIVTLMCDKAVFTAIPLKKKIKAGIAGIYIADIVGVKTDAKQQSFFEYMKSKFKKPAK